MINPTKEYWFEMPRGEKFSMAEKAISQILFKRSNIVRLTRMNWREGFLFKKKGDDKDTISIEVRKNLTPYFIRKEFGSRSYDLSKKNKSSEHYFYKLSKKLKELLNKDGIFFYPAVTKEYEFYGFEDLNFYNNDKLIGEIISHERMGSLYLTVKDKKNLEKNGVIFTELNGEQK